MTLSLKAPLRAAGFTGKLGAHVVAWVGEPQTGDPSKVHRVTRYVSTDPLVIAAQLDNMQELGIDFVIVTWQGLVNPFLHEAAQTIAEECSERLMGFCLLMDPWICKGQSNMTQAVENSLNDAGTEAMLAQPSYLPEKYVLDFVTGANLATLATAYPTLKFLAQGSGFSWPNLGPTVANLIVQNSNPAMAIPCIVPNFFDGGRLTLANGNGLNGSGRDYNTTIWGGGPERVIDHQAGNLYLDTIGALAYAKNAKYAAIATWNDHDEWTGIEQYAVMLTGRRIGK
jgi:hypothetical protein